MKLSDVSVARKSDLEAYYAENKAAIEAKGILVEEGANRDEYVKALKQYLGTQDDVERGGSADIQILPEDEPTSAPRTQAEQAASDGAATTEAQHQAAEVPQDRTQEEQAASDGAETTPAQHESAEVPAGRTQEEQAASDAAAPELKEAKDEAAKIDPQAAKDLPEPGAQPEDATPDSGEKKKIVTRASEMSEVERQAALAKAGKKQQIAADEEVSVADAKKQQKARQAELDAEGKEEESAPLPPRVEKEKPINEMESTELLRHLNALGFRDHNDLKDAVKSIDRRETRVRELEKEMADKDRELSQRETKIAAREHDFKAEGARYMQEREDLNLAMEQFNVKKKKLLEFLKTF